MFHMAINSVVQKYYLSHDHGAHLSFSNPKEAGDPNKDTSIFSTNSL